ncbi:MAG: hypothetical protein HOM28_01675 [Rhodospirillales bacterium]|jgi:hypothetical protein|nr:hypothetical protein [Rhodospirillales bacterium]
MKNLITSILAALTVLVGSIAKAETILYCQSELATGFVKENGSWRRAKFKSKRFTVKFNDDYSNLHGLDKARPYKCSWSHTKNPQLLICLSGYKNGESFLFNKKSRRFLHSTPSIFGFVKDGLKPDTEGSYAGTCQKF